MALSIFTPVTARQAHCYWSSIWIRVPRLEYGARSWLPLRGRRESRLRVAAKFTTRVPRQMQTQTSLERLQRLAEPFLRAFAPPPEPRPAGRIQFEFPQACPGVNPRCGTRFVRRPRSASGYQLTPSIRRIAYSSSLLLLWIASQISASSPTEGIYGASRSYKEGLRCRRIQASMSMVEPAHIRMTAKMMNGTITIRAYVTALRVPVRHSPALKLSIRPGTVLS